MEHRLEETVQAAAAFSLTGLNVADFSDASGRLALQGQERQGDWDAREPAIVNVELDP